MKKLKLNTKNNIFLTLGVFLLLSIIVVYHNGFVYDESWYYENIVLLNRLGLTHDFILHLKGPPGPLHALIYFPVFKLFSNNEVYAFRIFGFVISLISLYIVSLVKINGTKIGPSIYLIFACPVFYVVSGLALTEVPSLLFFSGCLFTLSKVNVKGGPIILWMLAGLLLSIAICGRQPAIMFLPAVFLSYIYIRREHLLKEYRSFTGLILFCIFSCILPFIIFSIWHGIVPKIGGSDATRESFSLINGLLGLGYLMIFIFLMFPEIILSEIRQKFLILLACFFLFSVANIFIFKQEFYFVNSVAKQFLSPNLFRVYGLMGFSVLICLSILSFFYLTLYFRSAKMISLNLAVC